MRKSLKASGALALLVGLVALGSIGAGTASAADLAAPGKTRDCNAINPKSPCIRWCRTIPEDPNAQSYPCGIGRAPTLTGRYTYSVAMNTATQNATGIAGDPGASGTANITLDLTNNRFCATTTWSGVDSKVAAGHIHQGAYGKPENPAVWISLMSPDFVNGHRSGVSYCETVPAAEMWVIKECPREFHTVIHSQNHPAAAIRGQLGTTCNLI
jgi:hypothetical protein